MKFDSNGKGKDAKPHHDFKAWAKKLKARHEAGEDLSPYQVDAYREALAAQNDRESA